jgi:hypothetical protein
MKSIDGAIVAVRKAAKDYVLPIVRSAGRSKVTDAYNRAHSESVLFTSRLASGAIRNLESYARTAHTSWRDVLAMVEDDPGMDRVRESFSPLLDALHREITAHAVALDPSLVADAHETPDGNGSREPTKPTLRLDFKRE